MAASLFPIHSNGLDYKLLHLLSDMGFSLTLCYTSQLCLSLPVKYQRDTLSSPYMFPKYQHSLMAEMKPPVSGDDGAGVVELFDFRIMVLLVGT